MSVREINLRRNPTLTTKIMQNVGQKRKAKCIHQSQSQKLHQLLVVWSDSMKPCSNSSQMEISLKNGKVVNYLMRNVVMFKGEYLKPVCFKSSIT
jgi:hypothetical protein